MLELTIGQVAGVINVGVVIAQLTFPLIIVFIAVGLLKDINNAVTWSVVGRLLNGSLWPTILQTDTAATTRVSKRVLLLSTISTLGLILLGIVSAVTPLGLSDSIAASSVRAGQFRYAHDPSPIGQGTINHTDYRVNRLCGSLDCPGQGKGGKASTNPTASGGTPTWDDSNMSSEYAQNITDIFSSATDGAGNTIAGLFDIQFRSYVQVPRSQRSGTGSKKTVDPSKSRTVGRFLMYQSLVMHNDFDVIEGLVVNMKTGGVGFRNHTIPSDAGDGAEWEEDLLWIEPETACVNTNLTVDFAINEIARDDPFLLTDRGGFKNLAREDPVIDRSDPQARPELRMRAFRGATLSNMNLMRYYNETREKARLGKSYNLGKMTQIQANQIGVINFIDAGPQIPGVALDPNIKINENDTTDWLRPGRATRGFVSSDPANISTIAVQTGLLLGAASRVGGSGPVRLDPGTNWSCPLFACASSVYASVKRVTFKINGTSSLSNLVVTKVMPKVYPNEASKPLWAVEDTGMEIRNVAPSWGLVADRYEKAPALWTRRAEKLYLPAGSGSQAYLSGDHGEAGAIAAETALRVTYSDASVLSTVTGMVEYSGLTNYPMFLKWESLSKSATTAPSIINLIWTDIMANYVIGTRSHLSRGRVGGTTPDAETASVSVITFQRRIRYDLRYAIPALVFLVVYIICLATSLFLTLFHRSGLAVLRRLLNQTAVGRAVTMDRNPDILPRDVKTNIWIREMGDEDIGIRKRFVVDPRLRHDGGGGGGGVECAQPPNDHSSSTSSSCPSFPFIGTNIITVDGGGEKEDEESPISPISQETEKRESRVVVVTEI